MTTSTLTVHYWLTINPGPIQRWLRSLSWHAGLGPAEVREAAAR